MKVQKDLHNLRLLADLVLDQELAKLAQMSEEKRRLERQFKKLEAKPFSQMQARTNELKTMLMSQARNDAKWQRWRRAEKINLNVKLAVNEAKREAQLLSAKTAFGRTQALQQIQDKLTTDTGRKP